MIMEREHGNVCAIIFKEYYQTRIKDDDESMIECIEGSERVSGREIVKHSLVLE